MENQKDEEPYINVLLCEVVGIECGGYDCGSINYTYLPVEGWEVVSWNRYDELRCAILFANEKFKRYNYTSKKGQYVLLTKQLGGEPGSRLTDSNELLEWYKIEKDKEDKLKAARAKKKAERDKVKKKAKAEEERKLYEDLKKKFKDA